MKVNYLHPSFFLRMKKICLRKKYFLICCANLLFLRKSSQSMSNEDLQILQGTAQLIWLAIQKLFILILVHPNLPSFLSFHPLYCSLSIVAHSLFSITICDSSPSSTKNVHRIGPLWQKQFTALQKYTFTRQTTGIHLVYIIKSLIYRKCPLCRTSYMAK